MEALYYKKGGTDEFNCQAVRMDAADIADLEKAVESDALPFTSVFFFGESGPDEKSLDLAFIAAAREALAEGFNVFYISWW